MIHKSAIGKDNNHTEKYTGRLETKKRRQSPCRVLLRITDVSNLPQYNWALKRWVPLKDQEDPNNEWLATLKNHTEGCCGTQLIITLMQAETGGGRPCRHTANSQGEAWHTWPV